MLTGSKNDFEHKIIRLKKYDFIRDRGKLTNICNELSNKKYDEHKVLIIDRCKLNYLALHYLTEAINNKKIKSIEFNEVDLKDVGSEDISKIISIFPIKTFTLKNSSLMLSCFDNILNAINKNNVLKNVIFNGSKIYCADEISQSFLSNLSNVKVKRLYFKNTEFFKYNLYNKNKKLSKYAFTASITNAMLRNKNLLELDFTNQEVIFEYFIEQINKLPNLKKLALPKIDCSKKDIFSNFKTIFSTDIQQLWVSEVTSEYACEILKALNESKNNTKIKSLIFKPDMEINEDGLKTLTKILNSNYNLRHFSASLLPKNKYTEETWSNFLDALKKNKSLRIFRVLKISEEFKDTYQEILTSINENCVLKQNLHGLFLKSKEEDLNEVNFGEEVFLNKERIRLLYEVVRGGLNNFKVNLFASLDKLKKYSEFLKGATNYNLNKNNNNEYDLVSNKKIFWQEFGTLINELKEYIENIKGNSGYRKIGLSNNFRQFQSTYNYLVNIEDNRIDKPENIIIL